MTTTAAHPANGMPFLAGPLLCEDCAHFDPTEWRCSASRDGATTARGWPACVRFQRSGHLGRILSWWEKPHHSLPIALAGAGALLAYPLHLLLS